MNNWMKPYKKLVHFLGEALGENYEIVLHVLSKKGAYIEEIVNNNVSGRDKNSPLTNLALEKIEEGHYRNHDYILNYKVSVKNNKNIRGSTFYIKDDQGELLGVLCINVDYSKYETIAQEVLQLVNVSKNLENHTNNKKNTENYVEVLSNDIEEVISSIIDPSLLDNRVTLSKDARIEIVKKLNHKGIFQMKGAIGKVAQLLKVSEPTIYRYLQKI